MGLMGKILAFNYLTMLFNGGKVKMAWIIIRI